MEKRVVLIGGGHGLSNMVKGFKNEDVDLTIVVSSSDDGGHTGEIRKEFHTVAVGDLRMVLNEFIKEDSSLKEIFDFRFNSLHGVNKVSLGNLMITSLWMKYKSIDRVIEYFREKEGIKANVYLSSNTPITLCAKCVDGEIIKHERNIGLSNKKIACLYSDNKETCNEEMLEKIRKADIIVLGPGSLYTSVGSVVCLDKIKSAIKESRASIVYVCNIMSQQGETLNYSVKDHEETLSNIMGKSIDRVIVNNGSVDEEILERYKVECSEVVKCDEIKENYEFYDLVKIIDNKVFHDSELTKKIILKQT